MDARTSIEPITVLKTKSSQLVERARRSRQPIIITQNGKPSAILEDIESYEEHRKVLLLLKFFAQGDQELRQGKGVSHAKATKHFEKKIRELQGAERA